MGTTDRGDRVFVKTFDPPGRLERLQRTLAFTERALRAGVATPKILGHDEQTATVVFELLDDPQSLLELFTESQDGHQDFDTDWCVGAARV
ncbi:hypothetical protein ACQ4WX_40735 [Streptomyces lasalocidi]